MVIGARDRCVGGDAGAFEGHGRGRARDVKCRIDQIFLCDAATVGATIVASSDPSLDLRTSALFYTKVHF